MKNYILISLILVMKVPVFGAGLVEEATADLVRVMDYYTENRGKIDATQLHLFSEKYSFELYDLAKDEVIPSLAHIHAWVPILKALPDIPMRKSFLQDLVKQDWYFEHKMMPSPVLSAWVLLAEDAVKQGGNFEEFFKYKPDPPAGSCNKGYLYALGLLTEAGSERARDILIERVAFASELTGAMDADMENQLCAEMAARGLLVRAYRDEDELALEALRRYRTDHTAYQQALMRANRQKK